MAFAKYVCGEWRERACVYTYVNSFRLHLRRDVCQYIYAYGYAYNIM